MSWLSPSASCPFPTCFSPCALSHLQDRTWVQSFSTVLLASVSSSPFSPLHTHILCVFVHTSVKTLFQSLPIALRINQRIYKVLCSLAPAAQPSSITSLNHTRRLAALERTGARPPIPNSPGFRTGYFLQETGAPKPRVRVKPEGIGCSAFCSGPRRKARPGDQEAQSKGQLQVPSLLEVRRQADRSCSAVTRPGRQSVCRWVCTSS